MTTKTKQELLNEIDEKNREIKELKKEVEFVERYKSYTEAAREIKVMQDAFVESGFTEEQALDLIKTTLAAGLPEVMKNMR